MNKKQFDELNTKVDLLFSIVANNYLADQSMKVYSSIAEKLKDGEEANPAVKEVMEKSLESYKHHSQNANDAVAYFFELFGEEANANIIQKLVAKGYKFEETSEEVKTSCKQEPKEVKSAHKTQTEEPDPKETESETETEKA